MRLRIHAVLMGAALLLCSPSAVRAESMVWIDMGPPGCTCDDQCQSYGLSYCNRPMSGVAGTCSNAEPGTPCPDGGVKDTGPDLYLDIGVDDAGPDYSPTEHPMVVDDDDGGCSVGGNGSTPAALALLLLGFFALRGRR